MKNLTMRNYFKIVFYFSIISFFSNCTEQNGEINYINLYSTSIISIKCESLKTYSQLKNKSLTNEERKKIASAFSKLKLSEKGFNVDARIFGFFEFESKQYNFCGGINIIEINNKKYFVDENLRRIIVNLTRK